MARIWRTNDGRHVPDGHPDAAFLAYGLNDTPPADVLAEIEGRSVARSAAKRRRGTADKQAAKGEDKAAAAGDGEGDPGKGSDGAGESTAPSGLTITRLKDQPEA